MIYADHAATTGIYPGVLEAMMPYLTGTYGNPGSLHAAGACAAQAVLYARETVANLLGCSARSVYFTSGGSESNNQALHTAAAWGGRQGRRHIVSAAFEHPSVLRTLEHLHGFQVTLLRPDAEGVLTAEKVRAALRPDTCLVSVMSVNNETGVIQPVAEIAALCRAAGVLFHTDAVQAAGQLPIAVERTGIDLLSLSAHKFHGPKGVGALICRRDFVPEPLIRGGGQERGCRAGTENVPGIVGLAAALEETCGKMTGSPIPALRRRLEDGLERIPGIHRIGAGAPRAPGITCVCLENIEREAMLVLLDQMGICASAGSACSSGALTHSHVLQSMGVPEKLARGALRLSLGADNTEAEVDAIVQAVTRAAAQLRCGKEEQ